MTSTNTKSWPLVVNTRVLSTPLALLCVLFAVVVLFGYGAGMENLYRPIADGPATHPLTATTILLLGVGVLSAERANRITQTLFITALAFAFCLLAVNIFDIINHTQQANLLTPFYKVVDAEGAIGKSNKMGINTSITLLFVAFSLVFQHIHFPTIAQLLSFLGIAVPTVSFTGYAYGLDNFYGQMSLISATLGFVLGAATLARNAHNNPIRSILSPYFGGKLARFQVLIGYAFPALIGYLMLRFVTSIDGLAVGLLIVIMSWFIILMVSISAMFQTAAEQRTQRLMRQLEQQAETDPLTQLPNRRRFVEFLTHELNRLNRHQRNDLCVLMLDIDHFKNVNDTAGHDVGDRVLVSLGALLRSSVRKVDLVARIGGEEFVVVLPDTNFNGAHRVATHLLDYVQRMEVPGWTDSHGGITTSIGIAVAHKQSSIESLLAEADSCLYQAKKNGRNRIEPQAELDRPTAPTT